MPRVMQAFRVLVRNIQTVSNTLGSALPVSKTHHKVLVSKSVDIFENLALEDWLHGNAELDKESILLMWHNKPVVVIGRHQNPWVECNVPAITKADVALARRRSGGGCVYHDEGNLNCSFLMHTQLYNRKQNLQLVVDAIKSRWNINLTINKRDDIVLDNQYKISGTASRLSGKRTYHHFTLLYDVDKEKLHEFLTSNMKGITSKATESVRMQVGNLKEQMPGVNFNSLVDVIAAQFLRNLKDTSIQFINPLDESLFPGITKSYEELTSWDWCYGKTPPFKITRTFKKLIRTVEHTIGIEADIKKGKIHDLKMNIYNIAPVNPQVFVMIQLGLEEVRLREKDVLTALSSVKMDWIQNGLYNADNHEELDWVLLCVIEMLGLV